MSTIQFVHWKDGDFYLGYLRDYPDYMTQGKTLEELKENLRDIYRDVTEGHVPGIRRVDELEVA